MTGDFSCRAFAPSLVIFVFAFWPVPALAEMGDAPLNRYISVEELEYGFNHGSNPLNWDSTSWIGGDRNRIWFKTEGETSTVDIEVEGEAQLLYSRLISSFWELQFGVRGDLVAAESQSTQGRGHLVFGLEGLAPYWFEVESTIFLSNTGDVSARLRTSYDFFITQRLIAHPSFELNVALQSVPDFGVGAGFNDIDLGLRLGYQIIRKFAPYIGVSWNQAFAETARLRREAGSSTSDLQGTLGLRFWF